MRHLPVLQAKRLGVYTIQPDDELKSAARKMQDYNISALVVVDAEGNLAGVLTRTDLVRACYAQSNWAQLPVRNFMAADVVTVSLDDPLMRVMELLIQNHIHRVVAVEQVNGKVKPVAVLSAADIVYHMAQDS